MNELACNNNTMSFTYGHDAKACLTVSGVQTPVKGKIQAVHAFCCHPPSYRIQLGSMLNTCLECIFTEIIHNATYTVSTPQTISQQVSKFTVRSCSPISSQDSTAALQAATTSGFSSITIQQSWLQPNWGYGSGPRQAGRAQQSRGGSLCEHPLT